MKAKAILQEGETDDPHLPELCDSASLDSASAEKCHGRANDRTETAYRCRRPYLLQERTYRSLDSLVQLDMLHNVSR